MILIHFLFLFLFFTQDNYLFSELKENESDSSTSENSQIQVEQEELVYPLSSQDFEKQLHSFKEASFELSEHEELVYPLSRQDFEKQLQSFKETFFELSERAELVTPLSPQEFKKQLAAFKEMSFQDTSHKELVERLSLSQFSQQLQLFKEEPDRLEDNHSQKLVDLSAQINDFEARLMLAQTLESLPDSKGLEEALANLLFLLREKPLHPVINLELGKIYLRQDKFLEAHEAFMTSLATHSKDPHLLSQIAIGEIGLGYVKFGKKLFDEALQLEQEPTLTLQLDYANSSMAWGDFYLAEETYLHYLQDHPADSDIWFKLAFVFFSEQRYEEAEQIYWQLLDCKCCQAKAWRELARLKLAEKNFDSALKYVNQALLTQTQQREAYLLKADILVKLDRNQEAIPFYEALAETGTLQEQAQALSQAGRAYLRLGEEEKAEERLQQARQLDPANIQAQYVFLKKELCPTEIVQTLISTVYVPQILNRWALFYRELGVAKAALQLYQAALDLDHDYLPARVGLAEMSAVDFNYRRALCLYKKLLIDFPQSAKFLLERARVVSWEKRYCQALQLYDQLIALNPHNIVPIREKARVAKWGHFMHLAFHTFDQLLLPSVNRKLYETWQTQNKDCEDNLSDQLFATCFNGKPYESYEELENFYDDQQEDLPPESLSNIHRLLIDHLALYRIQKSIYLEKLATCLIWYNRFIHVLPVLEELLTFSPGNEEAWFDYAQAYCTLGVCEKSEQIFRHLVKIDPLHSIAKKALARHEILMQPRLELSGAYWHETGTGNFATSNITRYQINLTLDCALTCSSHLRVSQNRWIEATPLNGITKYFIANGQTIAWNSVVNEYFTAAASFTQKVYHNNPQVGTLSLGSVQTSFNLKDNFQWGLGYDRLDELYDYFGVIQGTQSDNIWTSLKVNLSYQWQAEGLYRQVIYNDHNQQRYGLLQTSYALTEPPLVFKLIFQSEFRDTDHLNEIIIVNNEVVDIIHPYWTPKDYRASRLIVQWHHDYAFFQFCGAEKRYYDLKFVISDDTEHNPLTAIIVEWHHEFCNKWSIDIKAARFRSSEWEAEGAWATLSRYF